MDGYLYLAQMVGVAGVLLWGKLEWHAAILMGAISPVVTFVLAIILTHVLPRFPDGMPVSSHVTAAVILIIVGSVALAKDLRSKKRIP